VPLHDAPPMSGAARLVAMIPSEPRRTQTPPMERPAGGRPRRQPLGPSNP
jgi:hypothetical protein